MKSLIKTFGMLAFAYSVVTNLDCVRADTVTVAADNWCPYNCNPKSDHPGILVEIARKALAAKGHTLVYKNMPWSRAIEQARAGELAGIVGAYKEDAPDFLFPDSALMLSSVEFFISAKDDWHYTSLDGLKNITMGVIRDYSYGKDLDSYIEKNRGNPSLIQVASGDDGLETNIKKLLAGRIRVILEDRYVMGYQLSSTKRADHFTNAGAFGKEQEVFIAFSPKGAKSKEYAQAVSEFLSGAKETGEVAKIIASYGIAK